MPANILTPIPFVSGRYESNLMPMPLQLRLQYMAEAVRAGVNSMTIVAAVPSPFKKPLQRRVFGLSAQLQITEVKMQDERDCYIEVATAVQVLNKCIRAPESNIWYATNSVLMRHAFYVALQYILGFERFGRYRAKIALAWLRIKYPGRFLAVMMSRQVGKTGILAIVAALLIALARSNDANSGIAFYAQGAGLSETTMRVAVNLIRAIYRMIDKDPTMRHCVLNKIQSSAHQSITVEMPPENYSAVFQAVAKPGRVLNVRGSRENFLICDEFSFMPRQMVTEHIIPIMTDTRFGVFMTTPGTGADQGEDIMAKWLADEKNFTYGTALQLSLVCNECYVKPTATKCRHNLANVPPWKNVPDLMHAIRIAGTASERERLERELLGFSNRREGAVFQMEIINELCVLSDITINVNAITHKVVYLVVDPSIGSVSNTALYTMVLYNNLYVVIGAEDVSLEGCGKEECDLVIRAHFAALNAQYPGLLAACEVCPLLESNGGPDKVTDISRLLICDTFPVRLRLDVHGLDQRLLRNGRQTSLGGVYTDERTKEAGVQGVHDLVRNNRLVFDSRMVTSGIREFRQGRIPMDRGLVRQLRDSDGEPLPKMINQDFTRVPERETDMDVARTRILRTLTKQLTSLIRNASGISGKGASKRERDDLASNLLQLVCFVTRMIASRIKTDYLRRT